jgi:hypothetical protein
VKHLVEQRNHKVIEREQQSTVWFLCPTNHFVVSMPNKPLCGFFALKNHTAIFSGGKGVSKKSRGVLESCENAKCDI